MGICHDNHKSSYFTQILVHVICSCKWCQHCNYPYTFFHIILFLKQTISFLGRRDDTCVNYWLIVMHK